ncbi:MAG TPA: hypothetical protein VHI72_04635 [Hyphomicrobiaceae bacterium]|nr:hypothetical protein [Hyphomicrobiaceae bacterium]
MADGSRSSVLAMEADAAAAEAAREAKAELLERSLTIKSAEKLPKAPATNPSGRTKSSPWAEFLVDVWITSLNSVEFGLYKHSRNRAKSRQFTTDMDIFAEVIENGERTGLLGYREDLWRKNTGMDKRLVFKLFNETVNWRATMDLMIGRSLQLTLGARGLPVTCFSINVGDHENVVYLERSANKWPLLPEYFSFFLLDAGKPQFFRLRRDVIDLGGDYGLYNHQNQRIGSLDGKVFSIGGKWRGRVQAQYADARLMVVLKLFCGMLIFNGDCRRHMRRLARAIARGTFAPKLEKQEADLYMNPRRVR